MNNQKPIVSGFTGYGGKYYRTITLNPSEPDERKRFTFGEDKARLIIAQYEAIKAFAGGNAIQPLPAPTPQPIAQPVPVPQPKPIVPKVIKASTAPKPNWAALLNSN